MHRLDTVSLDLSIQSGLADAEDFGGLQLVPSARRQRLIDGDFLYLGEIKRLFWERFC
jgi:hypothetical protein